jgi:hypothetical protein
MAARVDECFVRSHRACIAAAAANGRNGLFENKRSDWESL